MKNGIDGDLGRGRLQPALRRCRTSRSSCVTTEVGVPVLWWRSVGHTHTAYAAETFIDEVGGSGRQGSGRVPPRAAARIIRATRACSSWRPRRPGWGTAAAAGRVRGVALARELQHLRGAGRRDHAGRQGGRQGRAGGLRGRLRHRRSTPTCQRADGGRHRLRARRHPARGASRSTTAGSDQTNFDAYEVAADRRDAGGRGPYRALDASARPASASPACRRSARRSPTPSTPPPASASACCRSPRSSRPKRGRGHQLGPWSGSPYRSRGRGPMSATQRN